MKTIRYGERSIFVQYLQLALIRAGYAVTLDGVFGRETHDAVKSFQRNNHLVADSVVGPKTWAALTPYLKGYTTHSIRVGDTFWSLASTYGSTVQAIMTANPTVNPNNLTIGSTIYIPFDFPLVPTNVYYSSILCDYVIEGLAVRYPFLHHGTIGKSVMGKTISYLQIGVGSIEVGYNASHHANEWLTTPVVLKFMEEYSTAFATGGTIFEVSASTLFCATKLYVVPMVNPDGVDLVTGYLYNGPFYRQAEQISSHYSGIPFPDGWKANIGGIDLNLQYPANWAEAKRIKFEQGFVTPAPRDYVGVAPLSAPESLAMYQFTQQHSFQLTLSYHSQGNLIYWKYLDYEPPRSREIADYFGEVSGYLVEETPFASGFAGYKDWYIQTYNLPGYTIEVGQGKSPLPLSQFDDIYTRNLGILVGGMQQLM